MGRVKVCFGILIAIILLGISGILIIDYKTDGIIKLIDETKMYSDSGDTENALESVGKLEEKWYRYHKLASILVRNEKISAVQESISRLRPLIEKENDELNAEFANARGNLEWIVESEIPGFTNIF